MVTLSRRALVARSSALVTAGLFGAPRGAGAAASPVDTGFVDAHVHVWTPDLDRYPLAAGFARKDMAPASFTDAELLATCRPLGVTRVVLIQMSFYGFDNTYMLDCMERHPGVFGGVAIVDHEAADVTGEMRRLAARGVRGFRLYANRDRAEAWGDAAGMRAMWTLGAEAGMAMCLLADPDALPAIDRMCAAFPRTPVVIDHFARIGMRGPIEPAALDGLCRLARFPHVHVKTSAFYALGRKRPPYDDLAAPIRRLRDAFGAERLMWATDCPYQLAEGQGYEASLVLVRDRCDFLTAAERAALLGGTAARVFFT
jgi:predicted TIM-barrel fold metal-dependent hydrolase